MRTMHGPKVPVHQQLLGFSVYFRESKNAAQSLLLGAKFVYLQEKRDKGARLFNCRGELPQFICLQINKSSIVQNYFALWHRNAFIIFIISVVIFSASLLAQ